MLLLGIPKTLPGLDLFDHVSPTCSRPQIMEVCTCAGDSARRLIQLEGVLTSTLNRKYLLFSTKKIVLAS